MTAGVSHHGDRESQEDAWLVVRRSGALLAVVCDGMGASTSGRPAADLVVEMLRSSFVAGADLAAVLSTVGAANRALFARSEAARRGEPGCDRRWQGMGTTAEVALFAGGRAHVAHVGDGRVYRFAAGRLEQLTTDHTLVNDYLRANPGAKADELAQIPQKVIVRAMGMRDEVEVDRLEVDVQPGDRFLLCSDGLTDLLDDGAIAALLARHADPYAAAYALVDAALAAPLPADSWSHRDNLTVVVHDVGEGGA